MFDFKFIEESQIKSDIELFKKYGSIAAITDYAILLGGEVSSSNFTKEERRAGLWWTSSVNSNNERCAIYSDGITKWEPAYPRTIGARPVISYELIKDEIESSEDNVFEIEFGEYPQTIAKKEISVSLEELYKQNLLNKTGKTYTADSINPLDAYTEFEYRSFDEYEYEGNKYIRFLTNEFVQEFKLSDETVIEKYKVYYLKVEPIKWIVDKDADIVISKDILFAGIQMDKEINNWDPRFESTQMKGFLDAYFYDEIKPSVIVKENKKNVKKESVYNFDYNDVSEEEIIKGCIESNIAVMLHGRSGDGKSARVKALDPDVEIIYLVNASPDSLCGKSIVDNGNMIDIPPTWYTKLVEKCQNEPDKIHIVFFDELTNAPLSIQGMAFNIVLDKEVNGKWKLPENARIVAAGNELEDSRSAYGISEPLFNRFAHVYIETKVDEWLGWASGESEISDKLDYTENTTPVKIHPSIYAFIAYKAYKNEDVLRTEYTGEEPNANPRKWEMASKVLYKTNQPDILKAFIGEDLTNEFISFTKKESIVLEEVINYNDELVMDVQEKFQTAVSLSKVDEKYVEIVREFVSTLCTEVLEVFDALWTYGNIDRLNIINELKKNKCYNKHI